ncbi:Uncharacterized protein TCM_019430 [Theobroma cacao]|uniref:non-specific serine/threonine protein kinase n=1 Tax=Theobroma cacao TaxID=3641 RepID=A0A061EGT0_THECC|nr:Uncharacterized protein TCM_019430 [Theobroma cacao]
MIRYSSINFISQTGYSISFMIYDTRAVAYIYYYPTINMFMQNLSFAAGASDKSYAVAQTRLPDDHPLHRDSKTAPFVRIPAPITLPPPTSTAAAPPEIKPEGGSGSDQLPQIVIAISIVGVVLLLTLAIGLKKRIYIKMKRFCLTWMLWWLQLITSLRQTLLEGVDSALCIRCRFCILNSQFFVDKNKSTLLDWGQLHHIIKGVASGLIYLHQDSVLRIIHRDIIARNILLDNQINPKILDFGFAKLVNDKKVIRGLIILLKH